MAEPDEVSEGSETELASAEATLEMILIKEEEIESRLKRAQSEAERMVEEAKLDAAAIRRESLTAEVGRDLREKEIAKAREEAEMLTAKITAEAEEIRGKGTERIEEAAGIVIDAVLPGR